MQRIREGLYLLEAGKTSNAYLLESQGWTLVDAGPPGRADALLDEIVQAGFKLDDLRRIVLTHAHPDHMGGVAHILRRKRVKVYGHPGDVPALEGRARAPLGAGAMARVRALASRFAPRPEPVPAVVPASPREPIRGLPQWQVLHTPGHTAGSLSLYSPAHGVLLCGDALTNREGKLAVADRLAGDAHAAAATLTQLAALDVDVLASGHGPVLRPRAWKAIEALLSRK